MAGKGGFESNAQNIQLLRFREKRRHEYDGLNLTRATIDGIMKYKHPYDPTRKKFYYADSNSTATVEWAAFYSHPTFETQSFECQIMDWADEVAYSVHDFEDAIHCDFISHSTFAEQDTFKHIAGEVNRKMSQLQQAITPKMLGDEWNWLKGRIEYYLLLSEDDPRKMRANRKRLTSELIGDFIKTSERTEQNEAKTDRYRYRISIPTNIRIRQLLLNKLIGYKVMKSARVQTLEIKGQRLVESIFNEIASAPMELFPDDWRQEVKIHLDANNNLAFFRSVSDYISGMTDAFAEKLYSRLFIPGSGSIHDFL